MTMIATELSSIGARYVTGGGTGSAALPRAWKPCRHPLMSSSMVKSEIRKPATGMAA